LACLIIDGFQSWDRQPFLTNVGQTPGTANLNPAYNLLVSIKGLLYEAVQVLNLAT
jgi:hypothetical protein